MKILVLTSHSSSRQGYFIYILPLKLHTKKLFPS